MRRIVAIGVVSAAVGVAVGGAVVAWRRNRRIGAAFVNSVINPILFHRGLVGGRLSEIGTLEHVGRKSGVRRLTPVHPEPTAGGFRIVAPLGEQSEWARNVLAAGHCRLQLHDTVYDLLEPTIVPAGEVDALPRVLGRVMGGLGFQYIKLRTFGEKPGRLEPVEPAALVPEQASGDQTATKDLVRELEPAAT